MIPYDDMAKQEMAREAGQLWKLMEPITISPSFEQQIARECDGVVPGVITDVSFEVSKLIAGLGWVALRAVIEANWPAPQKFDRDCIHQTAASVGRPWKQSIRKPAVVCTT